MDSTTIDKIATGTLRPIGTTGVGFTEIEQVHNGVWIKSDRGVEFYPWGSIAKIHVGDWKETAEKVEMPGDDLIADLEDLASELDEESDEQLEERAKSALESLVESFVIKGQFASEDAALDALTEALAPDEPSPAPEPLDPHPQLAPEFLDSVDSEGVDDDEGDQTDE